MSDPGAIPNLWPELPVEGDVPSPKAIMRRQALVITEKTNNRVAGQVSTRLLGREFVHTLELRCPDLGDFGYFLAQTRHPIDQPYPVRVTESEKKDGMKECADVKEFCYWIRDVLHAENTKQLVSALLSQAE